MSAAPLQQDDTAYRRPVEAVLAQLATNAEGGLDDQEAQSRLARYGLNELTAQRPVPAWRKFLAQFEDVLVILLLVATVISGALWLLERDTPVPHDAIAIFAVCSSTPSWDTCSKLAPSSSGGCAACRRRTRTSRAGKRDDSGD
jgi:Ca2+-transporting ATPase